jgi:O-antigen/teichoic acid export membrane protein
MAPLALALRIQMSRLWGRLLSPGLTHAVLIRGSFVALSGVVAQAIPFLATPLFTRLYDPSAFALYTIIASLVACIGGAAPMKFDAAISISRDQEEATALWQISTLVTVLVLALLFLIGRCAPGWLAHLDISPRGGTWLLVLVASGFAAAFQYNVSWLLHAHSYFAISFVRLARGCCFVGFALLFVVVNLGSRGLLFGYLAAVLVGAVASFAAALNAGLTPLKVGQIRQIFVRYLDFPSKAAIPSLMDLAALAAPVVAISKLYSLGDAAMYGLFRQAITAPLSLVSVAFGQVLTRQLAELIASKQRIYRLVLNTFAVLVVISCGIAAVVLFEGPAIFRVVYGGRWNDAGNIATILIVPAVLQFVASALSGALVALRRLTSLACWQVAYFLVVVGLIVLRPESVKHFLFGLAAIDVVLSLAYFLVMAHAISSYERR